MKPIRLSKHALMQCEARGTTPAEVRRAVAEGTREPAKKGRVLCRLNVQYNRQWQGETYAIKQVAPVIVEERDEIVVVTVYTFFF